MHVVEHAITDTEIPTGGGKDVKGNILTFNNPVFDAADKKQIGHDEGFCTRIAPKQGIWGVHVDHVPQGGTDHRPGAVL